MATRDGGDRTARERPGGIVKVQRSSNGRFSVTLPKEWADKEDLEPGDRVYVGASPDGTEDGAVVKTVDQLFS